MLTARDGDELLGMTISSFSSLSLDPPLILCCLDKKAKSHDGLIGVRGFAVHVLARDQETISKAFARPGQEKFDDVAWEEGEFGAPLLPIGVARLVCAHDSALSTAATTRS